MNDNLQTILIYLVAFFGPIAGIQYQKYKERKQAKQQRKGDIFRTLLVSQQDKASIECVKALNLLLIDFPDANQAFKKAINDYKKHLGTEVYNSMGFEAWAKLQDTKFDALLKEVAKNYDKTLIKDEEFETFNYQPQLQVDRQIQESTIRKELSAILSNKKSLNITVTNLHLDKP